MSQRPRASSSTKPMALLLPPIAYSYAPPKPHGLTPTLLRALPSASASASASPLTHSTALIIGAGLAGLAAATRLLSCDVPFLLLEASDAVGGRVRTDSVDGFLLDRGFQIFLTAYPEARRLLDYPALRLRPFYPGALVYHGGRFHRVSDPFRRPIDGLASLANPIGTLPDKLLVGLSRLRAAARPDADILAAPESPIADMLRSAGFSASIVDRFFRPFLGGIFFDPDLATTSRLFDLVFKCLALGDNALPAGGITAIPEQLAGKLPPGTVRLHSRAVSVDPGGAGRSPMVRLETGELLTADLGVIVAVEQPEAERLLPQAFPNKPAHKKPARSTVCLYFSADRTPVREPILILNGSGKGIVNNMFFATNVAPSYGPEGKALVSVSLVGAFPELSDEDLTADVVEEMSGWFGVEEVRSWRHLRTYRIGFAQPDQTPPTDPTAKEPTIGEGVYVCGDHRAWATFDGALVSGRMAADALLRDSVISPV